MVYFSSIEYTYFLQAKQDKALYYDKDIKLVTSHGNGTARWKNVKNGLNINIYSYQEKETSNGQSYNLYLNVGHFFNIRIIYISVAFKDSFFICISFYYTLFYFI